MIIKSIIGTIILMYICTIGFTQKTDIPEVNQEIISYVKTVIGKKVGRGECWDLADAVLTVSDAVFDKSTKESATIERKTNLAGGGCLLQFLGFGTIVVGIFLFQTIIGPIILLPLGIWLFFIGSRKAVWHECSTCDTRLKRTKIEFCPNCNSRFKTAPPVQP